MSEKLRGKLSSPATVSGSLSNGTSSGILPDYERLKNIPRIEGNEVIGDKTFLELGLNEITPQDIDEIIYGG